MTVQELLGVEHPLIQAPMAGVQGSALAAAVSNSGALGSLPAALLTIDELARELATVRDHCSAPVNVNFFCHTNPVPDAARERRWRELLAPYYRECGLEVDRDAPSRPGRQPFSTEFIPVLEAFRPEVVSFHFGLPSSDLVRQLRDFGAQIVSTATTVDEARWLEAHGVDAIIAQGVEAGGHRGMFLSQDPASQVSTFALVPQVVRAVGVPVIAAGGIASAAGVRAALTLGAAGVQVGTAYLLCHESTASHLHRTALQSDAGRHTALTNLFTGRLARGIVNRIIRELGPVHADVPAFPLASAALAPLRSFAERLGCSDFSPLWAGQNVSGCRDVPAAELTAELVQGTRI